MQTRSKWAIYSVVDEFHVNVDGPHAGDEEGHADVGAVEQTTVQRQKRLLGLLGLRELDQAPVLRRSSLQRNLQTKCMQILCKFSLII